VARWKRRLQYGHSTTKSRGRVAAFEVLCDRLGMARPPNVPELTVPLAKSMSYRGVKSASVTSIPATSVATKDFKPGPDLPPVRS
jgi:hypothetical protein